MPVFSHTMEIVTIKYFNVIFKEYNFIFYYYLKYVFIFLENAKQRYLNLNNQIDVIKGVSEMCVM